VNKLSRDKRCQIIASLVEGNSIRATCRMTDTAKGTVLKLLRDVGTVCAEYQDEALRGLSCERLQADEIWSFCHAKQKNLRDEDKRTFGYGDVWTFTAICADTKLVPTWRVGSRDVGTATDFMQDLAARLIHRAQITTDGHTMYLSAVEDAFGANVDYAMLQKIYGADPEPQKRYSPAKCIGIQKQTVQGNPDWKHVSTSYVERQNLTMRMSMRRFTRLTNAFSKKVENLAHAVALHFMYYNFCRIHRSLRVTPAMAAGVTERLWGIEDIVELLEARERASQSN
jgi:IS1 family transposase